MGNNKKSNSFVMQAGILAAAGIICKVIGILYRSPLAAVIGDEGNGYYSSAYEIYTIILLVSSYSIPSAISKVIAQRLALREYRNAQKIFRCAIGYVVVVGAWPACLPSLARESWWAAIPCRLLSYFAPTIFLRASWRAERLFPGTRNHGAHLIFPDCGTDTECGGQHTCGISSD
mgnify:CR=1 FL=1